MRVNVDVSNLGEGRWYEYAIRFVAGGLITAITGLIAKKFGAPIGGLFLAFPAIFPASATLIEKHEKERKQEHGLNGMRRGRQAASLDADGAAAGCAGLMVFALIVWRLLPGHRAWLVILMATLAWWIVSFGLWVLRKNL